MIRNYTWYNKKLNLNNPETIQQILVYGTIEEIKELKSKIGEEELRKIFLAHPSKIYRSESLNFITKFILNIKEAIDERKYLKDTLRNTRS